MFYSFIYFRKMKFGKVENPQNVDFSFLEDNEFNNELLQDAPSEEFRLHLGLPTFGRNFLKDFYPKGTVDELCYYAQRINAIEFNASYFNIPSIEQVKNWKRRSGSGLIFCPKVPQSISHFRQLVDTQDLVSDFCDSVIHFEEQLGRVFLQLPEKFSPSQWGKIRHFVEHFPKNIPLSVELRHPDFYISSRRIDAIQDFFTRHACTWVISDTAGCRSAVHMRLTTLDCFIRFNCTHDDRIDFQRLKDWAKRLKEWKDRGVKNVYFFIHQSVQKENTFYIQSATKIFNQMLGLSLTIPLMAKDLDGRQGNLF